MRVVRLSNRAPSRSSSACTWLLTMVVDMLRRRPAAENPPLSTTRTKAVRLVSRSIRQAPIICSHWIMLPIFPGLSHRSRHCIFTAYPAPPQGRAQAGTEDAMSITSYVSDTKEKISLRPSRKAVKRAALALAVALGVAGAGHFGYDYLTTGRYLESTDDAYVKADSTIISPKVSGYIARGAGRRQPAGQGRAAIGRDRQPRLQGRAGAGRCRCRRIRSRGPQPRCATRPAAADHRAGHG